MRVALKFAYNGERFDCYSHEKGRHSTEGDILKALNNIGAMDGKFKSASRTDRDVSALGNVIAFDVSERFKNKIDEIIPAINANIEHCWFYGWKIVPDDFNPRYAIQRWYRYIMPGNGDLNKMKASAKLIKGTHDFSNFAINDGKNTLRTIGHISIKRVNNLYFLDIKGQSFLWNMVRRIASAVMSVGYGKKTLKDIKTALNNKEKNKNISGLAQANGLILMDVIYSFKFESINCSPSNLLSTAYNVRVKDIFLSELISRVMK